MGGKAFINPPHNLRTPRLPTPLFHRLQARYHALLLPLFQHVGTPFPAPAKQTHGDIDFLVALPHDSKLVDVKAVLGATCVVSSGSTRNFAVPLCDDDARELIASGGLPELNATDSAAVTQLNLYAQVDVHVCPSLESFRWQLFQHGHGDLCGILGVVIRPFGLTANDRGLYVRIPEIDSYNRPRSLIFLTSSPLEVLQFLGYETEGGSGRATEEVFDKEFASWEGMFEFIARCRFFRKGTFQFGMRREDNKNLKSTDRRKMAQREGFRVFIDEWIPQQEKGNASSKDLIEKEAISREQVLEEALTVFKKNEEFAQKVQAWREERKALELKQGTREERKAEAAELDKYLTAWVQCLKTGL